MSGCRSRPVPLGRLQTPLAATKNTPFSSRERLVSAAQHPHQARPPRGAGMTNIRGRWRPARTSAASAHLLAPAPRESAPAPRQGGHADVVILGHATNAPTWLRPTTGQSNMRTPTKQQALLLVSGNVLDGRSTPSSLSTTFLPLLLRTTTRPVQRG
jgi:hypothetical protein